MIKNSIDFFFVKPLNEEFDFIDTNSIKMQYDKRYIPLTHVCRARLYVCAFVRKYKSNDDDNDNDTIRDIFHIIQFKCGHIYTD